MKPAGSVPLDLPGVEANHAIDRLTRVWVCDFPYDMTYGGSCAAAEQVFDIDAVHWKGHYDPDAGSNVAIAYRSQQPFIYGRRVKSTGLNTDEYFGAAACNGSRCRAVFDIECGRSGFSFCAIKLDVSEPEIRVWGLIPATFSGQAALLAQADEVARLVVRWYRDDPRNPEIVHHLKELGVAR